MDLLPLYDETAPIACTISKDEIPERIVLLERLRANLVGLDRTEHGMLVRFANRADVEADLQQFVVDEKRCCQFWGFEVLRGDDLTLRWDGSPDARDIVDQLAEWFQGTELLSSCIAGLL